MRLLIFPKSSIWWDLLGIYDEDTYGIIEGQWTIHISMLCMSGWLLDACAIELV